MAMKKALREAKDGPPPRRASREALAREEAMRTAKQRQLEVKALLTGKKWLMLDGMGRRNQFTLLQQGHSATYTISHRAFDENEGVEELEVAEAACYFRKLPDGTYHPRDVCR